jgi:WD40 repeat protein
VLRVLFEPEGGGLIAAGPGGCVRWPVRSGAQAGEFQLGAREPYGPKVPDGRVGDCVLGADGRTLAVAHDGVAIHVRDAQGHWRRFPCDGSVLQLDLSPDGRWLSAAPHHFGWARVWDLGTGRRVHEFACGPSVSARFTPDSRFLITASGAAFQAWNLATGQAEQSWPRPPFINLRGQFDWSTNAGLLAITRSRNQVELLDGFRDRTLCALPEGDWEVPCLAFSPSGRHLAIGRDSGEVELWTLGTLREALQPLHLDWNTTAGSSGPPDREDSPTGLSRVRVTLATGTE